MHGFLEKRLGGYILKLFMYIIAIIFGCVALVGIALCGINILQCIFVVGGSYAGALTGFLLTFCGGFLMKIFKAVGDVLEDY